MMSSSWSTIWVLTLLVPCVSLRAQSHTEPATPCTACAPTGHEHIWWTASSAFLAGTLAFDERIRSVAIANRSPQLDRIAAGADVLGTAGHIVPALVTTYVGSRLLGQRSFAAATLRVGLSYAAADAIEALLKPAVGRARPYAGHEPLTFRPFSANDDFHSFPSAHVVHISSLATAAAMEAHRPWVTALAGVAMAYVGAQRVYRDQHWSSDVVSSGLLGVEVAQTTMRWLHARDVIR